MTRCQKPTKILFKILRNHRMFQKNFLITLVILTPFIAGCALGPLYQRPDTSAQAIKSYINAPKSDGDQSMARWWERLNDPVVDQLVQTALLNNLTLNSARERVIQANEKVIIAQGAYFPSVSANLGGARSKSQIGSVSSYSTSYEAGLSTSWQLDLFGQNRKATWAAKADFQAAEAEREALAQTLVANIVRQRVAIATLARRVQLAKDIASSRDDTVQIVERRYRNGVDSTGALDIRLARTNFSSAQAQIPSLESNLTDALYGLDILLGRAPGVTQLKAIDFVALPPQEKIILDPPVALLDRRPDLRASELRLKAANENVGIAMADLYPNITFGGSLGFQDNSIGNLFRADQLAWSLLGTVTNRLFEGGKLRANIRLSESQARELASDYTQDVLEAVRDVESALQRGKKLNEQVDLLGINVEEARQAEATAQDRYRRGITNLLELLETQRHRQTAEQNLLLAQQSAWNARIDLYLSLGGDWQMTKMEKIADE